MTKRQDDPEPLTNPMPFTRQQELTLMGLTILALSLRLYELGRESLWFDEALSALFAVQPLSLSIQSMLTEGLHHSPLFYILLRPFAAGGFSEFSFRLLPALLGVLAVPLLAQLGRLIASPRVGILAASLLVINPYLMVAFPALLFLVAIGVASIRAQALRSAVAGLVFSLMLSGLGRLCAEAAEGNSL